eukprot:m.46324 g.46324  ORF g.46324 m.46324 type:complete len:462 (+) comp13138_c0_seq1:69-1454(+)
MPEMALAAVNLLQWVYAQVQGAPRTALEENDNADAYWESQGFAIADPAIVGFCPRHLARLSAYLEKQVAEQRVAGLQFAIIKDGNLCYHHQAGHACVEEDRAMTRNTLFRIYSMTKPITSAAVMMLYEQGLIQLDDPIHRYIPSFTTMNVAVGSENGDMLTNPSESPITIQQLLTHTSGLSYWFLKDDLGVCDEYERKQVYFALLTQPSQEGQTLKDMVDQLASCPLRFQPGTEWCYSNATDVLGYLIEVVSGLSLPDFFHQRIFEPLGMSDTAFHVPVDKRDRFAACYTVPAGMNLETEGFRSQTGYQRLVNEEVFYEPPAVPSGGGGLVSTMADYLKFCQMILGGGVFNGYRLLGAQTVAFMTQNHLQGDLGDYKQPRFLNTNRLGTGFGLGFSVVVDPVKTVSNVSLGECSWGGMASTAFWIDPSAKMACVFMTQLVPSSTYPFRRQLRALVNSALVD